MTTTYPLHFETGHLFVEIDGGKWLIDTGAPNTFGIQAFVINGQRVEPSTSGRLPQERLPGSLTLRLRKSPLCKFPNLTGLTYQNQSMPSTGPSHV